MSVQSLSALFAAADLIGNKYQSAEEIQAHKDALINARGLYIEEILDFCYGPEVELLEDEEAPAGALAIIPGEILEAEEVWDDCLDINNMSTAARAEMLETCEAFFEYSEQYLDGYDVQKCDDFMYELQVLLGEFA